MRRFVYAAVSAFLLMAGSGSFSSAQTLSYPYSFTGGDDGQYPDAPLIQGADGNFYGTANEGGADGFGTVFKVSASGTFSLVYTFTGGTDGANPGSRLVQGGDGNFYGKTNAGGSGGCGTLFKVTPGGAFTLLHAFTNCQIDIEPDGLIEGSDGKFYGTFYGGTQTDAGSLFSITSSGTYTDLYDFMDGTDGGFPTAAPIETAPGTFFGTTMLGGSNYGVLYEYTGAQMSVVYSFRDANDGARPGGIVEYSDGLLYGVATEGGPQGVGTVYKTTLDGALTPLLAFNGETDGGSPWALTVGSDGNFYGVTSGYYGAASDDGTMYELTPSGTYTQLYSFPRGSTGYPFGPFVQGSDGNFYGTTQGGGTDGDGAVYKLVPKAALAAPVQLSFNESSVAAGSPVTLTWKSLNSFSLTMQQCYAFVQGGASGAGTWTGKQAGTYNSGTKQFSGSAGITPTAAGTYTYALTCGGVESGFATLTVTAATKVNTATTVTATPNPLYIGQTVSVTATVTKNSGSGAPTGSVGFYADGTLLATVGLNKSGIASFTASSAPYGAGTYSLVAKYSGDSLDNASTSTAENVVLKAPAITTTALTVSPSTVTPPADVTLTATVSSGGGTPAGSVTFYADGAALATVNVKGSGVATLKASSSGVAAGTYSVTAKYNGATAFKDSTSTASTVAVK